MFKNIKRINKKYIGLILISIAMMVILCIVQSLNSDDKDLNQVTSSCVLEENQNLLDLYANSAVLMDAKSKRVLYSKKADEILPMASTTKIMTCIIALENGNLDDDVIVSAYSASMPKVKLYIKEGEVYKLRDLLYSLMLESHNDSAMAIAEHLGGGTKDKFIDMMNQKAAEIGCESTYFLTPNGLDDIDVETGKFHSTTATDLAKIMSYCILESDKKEEFINITQTRQYSFTNNRGRKFVCNNHNSLLNQRNGVISGKTGFTNKAGYCYVGAVKEDDRIFTVALLACGWPNNKNYKWSDCRKLFDYGFNTYHYKNVYQKKILNKVKVINGLSFDKNPFNDAYVELAFSKNNEEELWVMIKDSDKVKICESIPSVLKAPIKKDKIVGKISYYVNNELIKHFFVKTTENVIEENFIWITKYIISRYLI